MKVRQVKVVTLGPKKISFNSKNTVNTINQAPSVVNHYGVPLIKPSTVAPNNISKQIIKYVLIQNPEFDRLNQQLSHLRFKYNELIQKMKENQNSQNKQSIRINIQQVIESTKKIQFHMSRIVQDSNKLTLKNDQNKQNQQKQLIKKLNKKSLTHQQECLNIIQTVNLATLKIQQLQFKNTQLIKQNQKIKQCKLKLQNQNEKLKKNIKQKQNQKDSQILALKQQLNQLKQKKKKVQFAQGLNIKESLVDKLNDSRLSSSNAMIQTKKSQVYQV